MPRKRHFAPRATRAKSREDALRKANRHEPLSQAEVAVLCGVSPQLVQHEEYRALSKFRRALGAW